MLRRTIMRWLAPPSSPGMNHYRLDKHQPSPLEAAAEFAARGSVDLERRHLKSGALIGAMLGAFDTCFVGILLHDPTYPLAWAGLVGGTALYTFNAALIGLQRYNRARMLGFIDRALERGEHFDRAYRNPFGIDGRAEERYYYVQQVERARRAGLSDLDIITGPLTSDGVPGGAGRSALTEPADSQEWPPAEPDD